MKCKCGCEFTPEYATQKKCRPCKQGYDRAYHAKRSPEDKQLKLDKQAVRALAGRQYIWDYLLVHPCEHCGETDPVVLEFDHLDQDSKEYILAHLATYSKEKIDTEIAKCRVLCANCHRRHTAVQLGWYKGIIPSK